MNHVTGAENVRGVITQLRSHRSFAGPEPYLNVEAGYGFVGVWTYAFEACDTAHALLRKGVEGSTSGNHMFIAYERKHGIPAEFADWEVVWSI